MEVYKPKETASKTSTPKQVAVLVVRLISSPKKTMAPQLILNHNHSSSPPASSTPNTSQSEQSTYHGTNTTHTKDIESSKQPNHEFARASPLASIAESSSPFCPSPLSQPTSPLLQQPSPKRGKTRQAKCSTHADVNQTIETQPGHNQDHITPHHTTA